MAATLTLSAATLAADGKTITATISGGTGTGYTLGSAAGIVPHLVGGNAYGLTVASASVSGTTLTVVTATPFGTGESVQLDFPTSVTLTDSGANTPTGQTNLAVTNGSTVTVTTVLVSASPGSFELNGLYLVNAGAARGNTVVVGAGASAYPDAPVEWVTDATEVATLSYSGGVTQVAIDGATTFTTMSGTGFWSAKAATTSPLPAGKHLFRLALNSADYFYGVRLSGGTRTMYAVNTTKQTVLPNSVTGGYFGIPAATNVKSWATYRLNGAGTDGTAIIGQNYTGYRAEFGFTATGAEVHAVQTNATYWSASIDGGYEGALIPGGDAATHSGTGYTTIVKGLPNAAHTAKATLLQTNASTSVNLVRLINGSITTAASNAGDTTLAVNNTTHLAVGDWTRIDSLGSREWRQITAINGTAITVAALAKAHPSGAQVTSYSAPAGSFSTWVAKDLSSKRIVAIGDSNTQGANTYGFTSTPDPNGVYYVQYDARTPMAYQLAQALSMELVNLGIQGTDTVNQAGRAADIGNYGRQSYDFVLIWEGTNDMNANTVTPAAYGTNVQTQITAAKPYLRAGGKVILIPPGTPPGKTNTQGLNIAACASQLATLAAADPANVVFASGATANLVAADYDGGLQASTLHYTPSGQAKIAANLVPFLSGLLSSPGMFFAA